METDRYLKDSHSYCARIPPIEQIEPIPEPNIRSSLQPIQQFSDLIQQQLDEDSDGSLELDYEIVSSQLLAMLSMTSA